MGGNRTIVVERTYRATVEELWVLWTTRDGFQSWWGPQGFRADVALMEAWPGGRLHYAMVADSADTIAAMEAMGAPASQDIYGHFAEFEPHDRLVLSQRIDFLPGVEPYESLTSVDFFALPDGRARMVVRFSPMHDAETSDQQQQGFASQLSKLDSRFGWEG